MINWIYYPLSDSPPNLVRQVAAIFESHAGEIDSTTHDIQESNEVLSKVAGGLASLGFLVERGKTRAEKISVPVLFGEKGIPSKSFEADAYHPRESFVVEIEAGRAYTNYQFLKDLFEACMMHDVYYFAVAVRNIYRKSKDYEKVRLFFDVLFASRRIELPLKGILVIGY